MPGLSVLVVDDNSPDGTGRVADRLAERLPGVRHVLHRAAKEGLGRAYVDGFARALADGADFVDPDGRRLLAPARAIPTMLELIGDYDVVVGSRYVQRRAVGRALELVAALPELVGQRSLVATHPRLDARSDITAGFKCWRRATLLGIGLDRVRSNGYAFQVEMAYLTERLGYRVKEIPIYFEDRRIGKSKMSVPVKVQGAVDVFRIWLPASQQTAAPATSHPAHP